MTNEQRTMNKEQRTRCRSSQADWCGGRELGRAIQSLARRGGLAFFVPFYLYLRLYVDLRLVYYSAGMITEYGNSALLAQNGKVEKIGTKFGYTAWHPSGRVAAYSVNEVVQFFHSAEREVRDVLDLNSLIAYYFIDIKTAKSAPGNRRKPPGGRDRLLLPTICPRHFGTLNSY
jgi:hypothetical protein